MKKELASPEFESALVVGTGLIGTSIALRLSELGVDVGLQDANQESVEIAEERGAGSIDRPGRTYDLAIVAVPPTLVVDVVGDVIDGDRAAHVTDVGSTKRLIAEQAIDRDIDGNLFVPSHPMAGREIAGPRGGIANLFENKAWAVTPLPGTHAENIKTVGSLILACGAIPVETTPEEHDRSVALVSHMNHVVSSLLGHEMVGEDAALPLAGTGIQSTIRLAGGNPDLWTDILTTNGDFVVERLRSYHQSMGSFIAAMELAVEGETSDLNAMLTRGGEGKALLDRVVSERGKLLP